MRGVGWIRWFVGDAGWTGCGVDGAGWTEWKAEGAEWTEGVEGGVLTSLPLELTILGEMGCEKAEAGALCGYDGGSE